MKISKYLLRSWPVRATPGGTQHIWYRVPGTCSHDVNQICELVVMLPGGHQPLQDQDFEVFKHVASLTAHHLHIKEEEKKSATVYVYMFVQ